MDFSWFLNECTVDVVGGGLPPRRDVYPPPPPCLKRERVTGPTPREGVKAFINNRRTLRSPLLLLFQNYNIRHQGD